MKKSIRIAFCGVISALSIVFLYLGSIIWIFAYIVPLLSGMLIMLVSKSLDVKSSVLVYIAVSLLSIIMLPDKECAMLYIMFFGYYPIIKPYIDKISLKALMVLLKLIVFNTATIIAEAICVYIFNIPLDNDFGKWGIAILIIGANIIFVLYERLFGIFDIFFSKKIAKMLNKYIK